MLSWLMGAATGQVTRDRRSIEDPSTPLDWDGLAEIYGGDGTAAGVRVNRKSAMTYAAWWRGVNLVSDSVAKLPCMVYRTVSEGKGEGKERDRKHPVWKLLHRAPNPQYDAYTFKKTMTAHVLNHGNAYAWVERRGNGTPKHLWILDPKATWPVRVNGKLHYVNQAPSGKLEPIKKEDMLHLKGLGDDGLIGYDVISFASETLGLGLAAKEYGARHFRNAAQPSVVIEYPRTLTPEQVKDLRDKWGVLHAGLENAHRPHVLDNGATAKPFTLTAKDSQLAELRKFEIREIANFIGIPPHKLGDDSRTSHSSLEDENQSFLDDSLDAWLCMWELALNETLLSEEEKDNDTHRIAFLRQALVRANLTARGQFYQQAVGGPIMTQNEARAREDLPPVEGGDVVMKPLNMSGNDPASTDPVKQDHADETDEDEDEEEDEETSGAKSARIPKSSKAKRDGARLVLKDIAKRMVRRIATQAKREAAKPGTFLAFLDTIDPQHGSTIREALRPILDLCDVLGLTEQQAREGLHAEQASDALISMMRNRLLETSGSVVAAQLADAVGDVCDRLEREIPETLAEMYAS